MKSAWILLSCFLLLTACKPAAEQGDGTKFGDGNAQGKVQAKDFVVRSGRTRVHPAGGNQWIIELHELNNARPCEIAYPPQYSIDFAIAKVVGDYPVTSERTVAFNFRTGAGVDSSLAITGDIEITEINRNYVIGRIAAQFNSDNQVNGEFWAQICD